MSLGDQFLGDQFLLIYLFDRGHDEIVGHLAAIAARCCSEARQFVGSMRHESDKGAYERALVTKFLQIYLLDREGALSVDPAVTEICRIRARRLLAL
jgi:hypothetical protein